MPSNSKDIGSTNGSATSVADNLWAMVLRGVDCSGYLTTRMWIKSQLSPAKTTTNNHETNIFFYHPDHLGSSSFISNALGYAEQHLQYLPFGETFVDQQNGYDSRYTFSAKEKAQYSYFGARYYDSDLSVWLSVDPMSGMYPSLSPYAFCANNPVMLVDPDGRKIVIWYYDHNGDHKSFVFDGTNGSSAPADIYVNFVISAYSYNVKNGGGSSLQALVTSDKIEGSIEETNGESYYLGGGTIKIMWNAHFAELTSDNYVLSPATVLEEEATHLFHYITDSNAYWDRKETSDVDYDNKEEKLTKEQTVKTAILNGEVPKWYVPKGHHGTAIGVFLSTSNRPTFASNSWFFEKLRQATYYDWSQQEIRANEYIRTQY